MVSIAWIIVVTQSIAFAHWICLIGAALSAMYGAICSVPALLLARRAVPRHQSLVVGLVFACAAAAIQGALIASFNAWVMTGNAVAYTAIGTAVAVLVLKPHLPRPPRSGDPCP